MQNPQLRRQRLQRYVVGLQSGAGACDGSGGKSKQTLGVATLVPDMRDVYVYCRESSPRSPLAYDGRRRSDSTG